MEDVKFELAIPVLQLLAWTSGHLVWYGVAGVLLFVGTAVLGGLLVIYLPPQYFSRRKRNNGESRSLLAWVLLVGKNLLGIVLIVAGIAMLVLPGQGLLTIVIGLMLVSIPGKRELIASMLRRTGILERVNHWRAQFGREPLSLPSGR